MVAATAIHPVAKVERTVTLDLSPANGIRVTIDGKDAHVVSTGDRSIVLNEREHTLSFECINNGCEPTTRVVPPGKDDVPLVVELPKKYLRSS